MKTKNGLVALAILGLYFTTSCGTEAVAENKVDETVEKVEEVVVETVPNIVEVAVGNENFSTMVTAVTTAGLSETLIGEGPFTVFAPTNDAFGKLPKGTIASLLEPESKDALTMW